MGGILERICLESVSNRLEWRRRNGNALALVVQSFD